MPEGFLPTFGFFLISGSQLQGEVDEIFRGIFIRSEKYRIFLK